MAKKPRRRDRDEDFECPNCGSPVRAGARFCRQCGASDESGWGEEEWQDEDFSGGYGEDDFDYHDYVRREFPDDAAPDPAHQLKRLAFVAVVVLVCLGLLLWML